MVNSYSQFMYYMKRFIIFCTLIPACLGVFAQSGHNHSSVSDRQQPVKVTAESKPGAEPKNHKGLMHDELLEIADSLTASDYMMSIERVNDKLNAIRDSVTLEFEFEGVKRRIDDMTDDISIIRNNTRGRKTVVNIKNLYLYQSFASHLNAENLIIQKHIARTYNRVYNAKLGLKNILSDTVFHALYENPSLRNTYDKRLVRLERKWARTDSITKASIDTLNAVKVEVADNTMSLSGILSILNIRLDKSGKQLLGPEVNYIWQSAKKDTITNDATKTVFNTLGSEKKAIAYYVSQTSAKRVIILFLGIILFTWLFSKRKLFKTIKEPDNSFDFLHLRYLSSYPVLSLLVVLMCLMPFFDAYAPTSYISIEYLLLLVVSTIIFFKKEDFNFMLNWLILIALFIVNTFTYLFIEPTLPTRLWLLAVHISIIAFSFAFYRKLNKDIPYYKPIKRAALTGIILTVLAVLCNITGRFSLSGIFGIAGIFAFTQAVVLPIFIDTVTEIVLVQLQSSRIKKGFYKPFDCSIVDKKIKIPMYIIAMVLWFMMLTSNLNIYHGITNGIIGFLTTPRTIGSISVKLISIIWFIAIIWIAHILQKLISFLFGETGTETDETTSVSKKQHSRLLITRLLVLVCGYLIAIAASGLPIDKLTIVLGALGVGIGMGLQNVVNNFVSGIILIFDGSLQIGDVIEISGQAGKVKEIGLRASTLSTSDGAEVIIPNGNILSQNIVNWTFSNDQKRIMIWFTLSGRELDANIINEVINSTIVNIPDVIKQKKPVILFNRATPENCTITVRFWSTIDNADTVKSQAMIQLSAAFEARKIKFE
jgi:potassium-dependent mechanosensitive channel